MLTYTFSGEQYSWFVPGHPRCSICGGENWSLNGYVDDDGVTHIIATGSADFLWHYGLDGLGISEEDQSNLAQFLGDR